MKKFGSGLPLPGAYGAFVLIFIVLMTVWLARTTYYINAWPSDSAASYIPTAEKLFEMRFFSQMHDLHLHGLSKLNMRGKEALVVAIAVLQRLLGDTKSLYPNILLLILSVGLSAGLLFLIFKKIFNAAVGFIAFVLFACSFWPYMYVLLGAHQPLVLCHFLLSFFFLQRAGQRRVYPFLGGLFFGLVFFSSPTAIMYMPYYGLLLLTDPQGFRLSRVFSAEAGRRFLFFCSGLAVVLLAFTLPRPLESLKMFIIYVFLSRGGNHFQHYADYLNRFFPVPAFLRGGGWLWILKYFMLTMPVLFAACGGSVAYLLSCSTKPRKTLMLILLGLSTPLAVEIIQVAQFGRNYFSWFFGMIFLACTAAGHYMDSHSPFSWKKHRAFSAILAVVLASHVIFNAKVFFQDVLPSRLATTYAYAWLRQRNIGQVLVYQDHHSNTFAADVLNNPKAPEKIRFWGITSFLQAREGYILLPGISGTTIWNDCSRDPFTGDPALQAILAAGLLPECAVARFQTVASSRYWPQEEEVCTYRDLMLGQVSEEDRRLSEIYILDVARLRKVYAEQILKNRAEEKHDKQ
ncbi:MAG TPA: glycosyltransferase family 39 protein [Candidatus Omnitrophota bacterium]|mgnify:CR=1 FL=1|nr:glycosyltransferase family 39 protein [Candidatus Omnitrophota bacterium]HPB67347.1 glycosyltransferase family 39 protein [Candidatus Omnitrophota bacterium]HQO57392.1 glycosyltransferase family 39 protein [Candidatus Omnitrophota bacterium]HQP11623.1 glycosyltransferase family 39 protein [Candidatus Omnitrophota bacterium]